MVVFEFQKNRTLRQRTEESTRIMKHHPDRLPIIVEKHDGRRYKQDIPNIDKSKFLVPYDINVGQFIYVIRKRIKLSPEIGLFLFVGNTLPSTSELISEIYNDHKDVDGFLYVKYAGEEVFG